MKKRAIILLFSLLFLNFSEIAAAEGDTFSVYNLMFKIISEANHEVSVSALNPELLASDLKIPDMVINGGNSYTIAKIEEHGFSFCSIESVSIPNTITIIGDFAFANCYSLRAISMPPLVQTIGNYAFSGCHNLTSVSLPNSVKVIGEGAFSVTGLTAITIPNTVVDLGDGAFAGCSDLAYISVDDENVSFCSVDGILYDKQKKYLIQCPAAICGEFDIPTSVNYIRAFAFFGCQNISSINIPNSVNSIGNNAFQYCSLTSIVIPNSVMELGESAFNSCFNLKSVNLSDSINTIGDNTFYRCVKLSSIDLPPSVKSIGHYAFYTCRSLTYIDIPDNVSSIGADAFYECSNLQSINIGNSVIEIGESCFQECSSLSSIILGKSVSSIRWNAFAGCINLSKIVHLNSNPPSLGQDVYKRVPRSINIYVPKGALTSYQNTYRWYDMNNVLEMGNININLEITDIELYIGETIALKPIIEKDEEVYIDSETWSSTNEDVVSVTQEGIAIGIREGESIITYKVIDNYGVAHIVSCSVKVGSSDEVIAIFGRDEDINYQMPIEIYDIHGCRITCPIDNLPKGIYIIRQGKITKKIIMARTRNL